MHTRFDGVEWRRGGRAGQVVAVSVHSLKEPPSQGVGLPNVVGLGVPEAGGDGLGCLMVLVRELGGAGGLRDGSQFGGHGDLGQTRGKFILSRVLPRTGSAGVKRERSRLNRSVQTNWRSHRLRGSSSQPRKRPLMYFRLNGTGVPLCKPWRVCTKGG